jgi:hypothetical protein
MELLWDDGVLKILPRVQDYWLPVSKNGRAKKSCAGKAAREWKKT